MFKICAYICLTLGLISVGINLEQKDYNLALSWFNNVIWCRIALDYYNKLNGE